ncbi:hypothetical protein N752_15500 [Desulforamulus aquiferis]|nr:hypothetical protein N752_15500 [Desulforamulus aquiferis]
MSKLMDIIGHKEILQTLRNSIKRDKLAHAYLFAGPPGVGKKLWPVPLPGFYFAKIPGRVICVVNVGHAARLRRAITRICI